jgi:hypothetical protein
MTTMMMSNYTEERQTRTRAKATRRARGTRTWNSAGHVCLDPCFSGALFAFSCIGIHGPYKPAHYQRTRPGLATNPTRKRDPITTSGNKKIKALFFLTIGQSFRAVKPAWHRAFLCLARIKNKNIYIDHRHMCLCWRVVDVLAIV